MTESELVSRVADAMHKVDPLGPTVASNPEVAKSYRAMAKAAIKVVRQSAAPSEEAA